MIPAQLSYQIIGALLTFALLATFGQAFADDRGDATGNYYYDRYALPWVKAYAPPDTAPGTYDERANGTHIPRGTSDAY